jgi:hypothetical protein
VPGSVGRAETPLLRALAPEYERYGIWATALLLVLDLEDARLQTEQQKKEAFRMRRQAILDALRENMWGSEAPKPDLLTEGFAETVF